jgi:hypothetical protein
MLIAGSRVGYRTQCGLLTTYRPFLWVGHCNSKPYIAFCDTLGSHCCRDDGSRFTTEPETRQGDPHGAFDSMTRLLTLAIAPELADLVPKSAR